MRHSTLVLILAISALVSACASNPNFHGEDPRESVIKQCSQTQHEAISTFFEGVKGGNFGLLNKVTPDGLSLAAIFGDNDTRKGREIINQILAHPEVASEGMSCSCSLLSMTETDNPQEKIVVAKRSATTDDEVRDYVRAFRVRFALIGNCIIRIFPANLKWERIFD